jgi:hypothetical protein
MRNTVCTSKMYSAVLSLRKLTEKDSKYVCIHKIFLHWTEPYARKKDIYYIDIK